MRTGKLLRSGHHNTPLFSVCLRADIGNSDQYGRGIWISESDIPKFEEYVKENGTHFTQGAFEGYYVDGTNRHNQVLDSDLGRWFRETK